MDEEGGLARVIAQRDAINPHVVTMMVATGAVMIIGTFITSLKIARMATERT